MDLELCFIKEDYFKAHTKLLKILDPDDSKKQTQRTYLFIFEDEHSNKYYIPLRTNLGYALRKFGRIGHSLPSQKRPKAGLDFRHALIVNDSDYLEPQNELKIPQAQYNRIKLDLNRIQKEFVEYVNRYKKMAKKKRTQKEPLFRDSSLVNFHSELELPMS